MFTVLMIATCAVFALLQVIRLAGGERWSWTATAAYGVALASQFVARLKLRDVKQ